MSTELTVHEIAVEKALEAARKCIVKVGVARPELLLRQKRMLEQEFVDELCEALELGRKDSPAAYKIFDRIIQAAADYRMG